jgi:hypothetical protein
MKGKSIIILLSIIICSFKCGKHEKSDKSDSKLEIKWVEKIESNFEFANNWSYPEGVYVNRFGQLSCDGICPIEIDEMKDDEGRIKEESLKAFYEIIDTTHLFYSLESESNAPEFTGSDFIQVTRQNKKKTKINTSTNVGTHSSLNIEIDKSKFTAWIDFNSITPIGNHKFTISKGNLIIERKSWEQGILKAEFDFVFENTLNQIKIKTFNWKGKVLKEIEK